MWRMAAGCSGIPNKKYDLMFSDVYYSFFAVPPHFTTREFFVLAKSRLAPGGVLVVNMIGDLSRQQPSLILAEIKTFQSCFPTAISLPWIRRKKRIRKISCWLEVTATQDWIWSILRLPNIKTHLFDFSVTRLSMFATGLIYRRTRPYR